MAEAPSVTNPKAQIFIGTGAHGVDKLFILPAPSFSCREQLPAAEPTAEPLLSPSNGVVAFFVGDQVEDARQPPRVRELQDPRVQAALTSDAFPGAAVAVVMPSRLEGGCACFDHFLHRTTATGEPLGYRAGGVAGFKAAEQLATLLQSAGLWTADSVAPAAVPNGGHLAPAAVDSTAEHAVSATAPNAAAPAALGQLAARAVQGPSVHLVGFSKGGVALNQLLTELSELYHPSARAPALRPPRAAPPRFDAAPAVTAALSTEDASLSAGSRPVPASAPAEAAALLGAVASVHYVDAGVNSRGAYLTDPQVAQGLGAAATAQPRLRVTLHGTPRQWDDPLRPWLAVEKNRSLATLRAAGVSVQECKYFEGQPLSLLMHFECITAAMAAIREQNAGA